MNFQLPSGLVHGERRGDGELVVCVHGLSANLRGFDAIAETLTANGRSVLALDLRGRGASEVTPPGSYGLESHARDVLAIADELGAERFDYIGWSMGALVGIRLAGLAPERLRSLRLIDAAGRTDPAAGMAVFRALERLDLVVPDEETYLEVIRGEGLVTPWSELWQRYFTYELAPREGGGFAPRTNKAACLEDAGDIGATDWPALWPAITMPATLIRATVPLGGGDVVPLEVRDGIQAAVPQLELVEVERNHYGVMEHPEAIAAML